MTRVRASLGPGLETGRAESALRAVEEILAYLGGLILLLALLAVAGILVEMGVPASSFGHHFLMALVDLATPLLVLGFVLAGTVQTLRVLGHARPIHVLGAWGLPRAEPSAEDAFLIESVAGRALEVFHYYAVLALCLSVGMLLGAVQLAYGLPAALVAGGAMTLGAVLTIFAVERIATIRKVAEQVTYIAPLLPERARVFRGSNPKRDLPTGVLSRASFFENLDTALAGSAGLSSYTLMLVSILEEEAEGGFEMPWDQESVQRVAQALTQVTDPADLRGYLGNGIFGVGFSGITSGGAVPRACRLEEELLAAARTLDGPPIRAAIGMATAKPGLESRIEFYQRAHASFQESLWRAQAAARS